ncbi:hypothetical protein Poli38472_012932 [Pythium oligandrum]|uniref:HEAT repeat-containing protein 1 n=1 Tax=Pythium oligandrum TaxID=41045 RepID=A0A8K1CKG2_PYTOL|nr:hypothetical protein Poli38472_012932 [Pythium oligandrum]|eukprot:TMW64310.1 hypothetical protein Poli38472_012932 [Pythium oligandrum]
MVSSLAAQLQQLREGGAGNKRKTDTFLYDAREAAQIDDETVYNLAWNGLLELKQLDAVFEEFDPSRDAVKLFSRQRIHFHRVQITKAEDAELNAALAKLLDALSGYFLLGATHKVLEFLVRRYEIHRFNVNDVMAMIISYHESKWFAKMVKILHIHNTRWEFLLQVKQTEEPLLRNALVQRSIDESSVIEFIFTSATRIGAANPKLISLYALVVLQMLEQSSVNEPMLRWLIPELLIALKTQQFPEMQATAYMILTKLSSKAVLSAKVVETLVKHLVKYAQKVGGGAQMNALLCLIFVAETQPSFDLSKNVGKYLTTMENLVDILSEVAGNYESVKFIRHLVSFLVARQENVDDAHHQLLLEIVPRVTVFEYIVTETVEKLLESARDEGYDSEKERVQAISGALVAISKKFVEKTDESVQSVVASASETASKNQQKQLNKFLKRTFGQVANSAHFVPSNSDAKTTLALALEHPTESTRFQALQALEKQHASNVEQGSTENVITSPGVLLRRLQDDSARIVEFVVTSSLGGLLLQLSSKKKAFEAVVQVIHRWTESRDPKSKTVVDASAQFLVGNFRATFSSDLDDKILVLLLTLVSESRVEQVWDLISQLDHPFATALSAASGSKSVSNLAEHFGAALADKDFTKLLPFCLSWSKPSDVNVAPLTSFLIQVLRNARQHLHQKKSKAKSHKEHTKALDQALRFVLKKEFTRVCELPDSKSSVEAALDIAQLMGDVAAEALLSGSTDDFDACIVALLQAPVHVFAQVQGVLVQIFHEDKGLGNELLPTMGRILLLPYVSAEDSDLLLVLAKIRALDIVSVMLEENVDESDLESVLPIVLVALGDDQKSVREAAVTCLQRWEETSMDQTSTPAPTVQVLLDIAHYLITAREDILMDSRAITTICGTYQEDDNARFAEWAAGFVVRMVDEQLLLAVKLLEIMTEVNTSSVWVKTTETATKLISGLSEDDGQTVLEQKLRALKLLLSHYFVKNEGKPATKATTKAFYDVLTQVLQHEDKARLPILAEAQSFTLSRLSGAYFSQLDDVSQYVLVTNLLQLLMVAEESVASQLIRSVNELPLTSGMFVRLLTDELASKGTTKTRHRGADVKDSEFFQDLSCILEVLAIKVDDVASEGDASALLKTLNDVLALLCQPEHRERVSEYLLQIVFGCLRRVCEVHALSTHEEPAKAAKRSKAVTSIGVLEPEHLVKHTLVCLGRTTSPQTRNEALLFISALVNVYPASVLSSLDKILSFVGSGGIHHEDDYSFNVLETIIKAVVPHIVRKESLDSAAGSITSQQFIRIFVDAYDQIPAQRREFLYTVIVQSLGTSYLSYVVIAIVQNGVLSGKTEDRVKFAHQLCFAFGAVEQISSLVMQLRLVRDLYAHVIEDSETDTDDVEDEEDEEEQVKDSDRIQWDKRVVTSQVHARQLNIALMQFIPVHLQARELHHQILKIEEDNDEDMEEDEEESAADKLQQHYLVLAQVVLLYFRRVARQQTVHEDVGSDGEAGSLGGFWTELSQQTIEILGSLQQLLSTPGFVAVISELLHHDNSLVRKKAMQLFNERLQDDRSTLTPGEELLFVEMVDELDVILQNSEGTEHNVNIQTALLSVDILARNFAAQHTKRFQTVLPTIIKYVELDLSTNVSPMALHLMGCAYVSLSSICRAVGPLVFPYLPKFFPNLLAAIDFCATKSAKSSDSVGGLKTVLQCLLAALEVFTDHIPQFLTPYLSKIAQVLLTSSLLPTSMHAATHPLSLSVDSCFLNLTNHVDLRHLLPNLFGGYEFALTQGDHSVEKLFSVVSNVVTGLDTAQLRQYLPQFARFFVTSLDLRRVHIAKLQDIDAVEDEILEVLVQFILRLSEKQLKPLFLKIAEWAQHLKQPHGEIARRIVFFKLLLKLSERLKSIFVPYYAHVFSLLTKALSDSREVLASKKKRTGGDCDADDVSSGEASADDDDDFFARDDDEDEAANAKGPSQKKRKLLNGSSASDGVVSRELYYLQLQIAVRALNGCFVHDSDGFVDKDMFDVIMTPLVDTIDILKYMPAAKEFVNDTVAECVANLAWAAKNDLLWKPLHYAVLMKSRGDCAAIRLATLKIVDKCYTIIGDEFLAMLPESIPFLSELMEDNDAEVERTCHQVIKQIEDISGESLDQYLTA